MDHAQKVINAFEAYVNSFVELTTTDEYNHTILQAVLELLKEKRWVPVNEGLPKYTGTFLVWVGINQCGEGMHMECRTAMFYYPMQRFYVHREAEGELIGSVAKWMPRPEPPREG